MNRLALLSSSAALVSPLLLCGVARAASLDEVDQDDWWQGRSDLPSYVSMFLYVPDGLGSDAPVVVAPHHCQGTGPGTFSEMSSLVSIADATGFIMIFPEATGQNCWDAGSDRSLTHGGNGDTGAIVQMVDYVVATYGADRTRVYAVGGSSGGIMTEALLGVYPDVFLAGVSLMGVPCGCWAEGYNDVVGNGSTAQWSSCAGGNVSKTAEQWGDLVRSSSPDFTGHRPRLQHWHGTADTVIDYKNHAEDIKQWPNVLGLDPAPTGTDQPKNGVTRQYWNNDCGFTVYEAFALDGVGHSVPFDGPAVAAYFGLDQPGAPDPERAACGGGTGSGGASSGGTDSGGSASGGSASGGDGSTGGASSGAVGGTTSSGAASGADGGAPSVGGTSTGNGGSAAGGTKSAGASGGASSGGGTPGTDTGGSSGAGSGGAATGGGAGGPSVASNATGCSLSSAAPPRSTGNAISSWALLGAALLTWAQRRRTRACSESFVLATVQGRAPGCRR